ncbi:hypothetical protein ACFVUS_27875 [Nocardia sp. NPDC058058]|uniref:hypothetical protein n=1 Tax=Nocardia sp. NPDC058058 TaxID=3346317 RepID=UPI0036DA33FC
MVSWRDELARRETAAAEQVEHLRRQIAELTEQLVVAEQMLSKLVITRETMTEILTETDIAGPEFPERVIEYRCASYARPPTPYRQNYSGPPSAIG